MSLVKEEQKIEQEYHVSWYIIVYKFLFGLVEFSVGITILIFGHQALSIYKLYVQNELAEDPHDLIVHVSEGFVPGLLAHNTFLAIYLMLLGGAKMVGAVGLIFGKNWGVDLLVGLTTLMLPFQLIALIAHPSIADFLYITIGVFIALYLINFKPHAWVKHVTKKGGT